MAITQKPPHIIYLDQNKWIELLRAQKSPSDCPREFELLQNLVVRREANEVVLPLSSTNIYETYKIGDPERRRSLGHLQARLSGGLVFRGRHLRLEAELISILSETHGVAQPPQAEWWFLSDVFYEAFTETGDDRTDLDVSARFLDHIRRHPATMLYDYFASATDADRSIAVQRWSKGSEALRARIETRRQNHKGESFAMRKRIYNAIMFSQEVALLAQFAAKHGIRWNSVSDIGEVLARRLVNDMPIYHIERELAVRLEDQNRPLNENDFRDVQAYCAAIPYADEIIGENLIINLARQAGLGVKYGTKLGTDLEMLAA